MRIREIVSGTSEPRRTQERTPWYVESSAIYLSNIGELKKTKSFIGGRVALIPLDPVTALDIDTISDFKLAQLLLESQKGD
jgi:CMP-N-acetylneuraminic acid synthetase